MKRFNDDYTVGDIMKEFIKGSKLENGLDAVHVKELWASLMGPTILNYTTQVDFFKGQKKVLANTRLNGKMPANEQPTPFFFDVGCFRRKWVGERTTRHPPFEHLYREFFSENIF